MRIETGVTSNPGGSQFGARAGSLSVAHHHLTPAERIMELEVRSGTTLDANLKLRTLSFAEWQAKVKSPEHRAIEQKLSNRPQP